MTAKTSQYARIPLIITFQETSQYKDTYAGEIGTVALTAHLLKPENSDNKTAVVFMHPTGGGSYLPMLNSLARQGIDTVWCDSRYRGTDSALIMEKVLIDLGNCIKNLKERHGYEKIVLGGWSGGGSLSLFYQSQAEKPSITETPAGDPIDLISQNFIPADAVMLIAAHESRHRTFTEWLDGSVIDENNPEKRALELDIYDKNNPNQPKYSNDFIETYRKAQIARNRKITSWVQDKLNEFKKKGYENREYGFVVHRTMADPKWLDPSIDPNGRKPKDRMRIWFFNEKEGMFKNVDDFEKEKLNDGKLHLHILMECVDGLSWLMKNNRKITIKKSTIFDIIAGDYVMDDVIIEALTNHLQAHIRRLGKSKQSMVSELIKNIDKRRILIMKLI